MRALLDINVLLALPDAAREASDPLAPPPQGLPVVGVDERSRPTWLTL